MKKQKLLSAGVVLCGFLAALPSFGAHAAATLSEEDIPDANFAACVLNQYKSNVDSSATAITDVDPSRLTSLNCASKSIQSVEGIEKFTALESLYLYSNNISSIDLSQNGELVELYLSDNMLKEIDLSNNTMLVELSLGDNCLEELDVSQNTLLRYLYVWGNKLSVLDLTKNRKLIGLDVSDNTMESIDVEKNTHLDELWAKGMTILIAAEPEAKGDGYELDLTEYYFLGYYNLPMESENYTYDDGVFSIPSAAKLNAMNGEIEYYSTSSWGGNDYTYTVKFGNKSEEVSEEEQGADIKVPDTGLFGADVAKTSLTVAAIAAVPAIIILAYVAKRGQKRAASRVHFEKH